MLETAELEAIIARTALRYDLLPYESKPFAQSQPARLGALARLFGLDAAPLETARVLELGCASGGNIIPHAVRYPDARFVGVDLARTQVAAGRARIARLGLKNIEILCQSFTEIDDELGDFDYIICHGVYSWVPTPVQDAIFRVIRSRLAPGGIACVSYNVLPGWRMLQPVRDAFLLQVPDSVDALGRVAQARELMNFLKDASPDKGPYGDMLRAWGDRMAHLPDDYIAHEFLEECNSPSTVRDFVRLAGLHGLGYLGECELSSMILENYSPELAEKVRARSGNNLVETEQYLDLLSGRTFRQSLLVGEERMASVDRALSAQRIAGLHFQTPAGMRVETNANQTKGHTAFTDPFGRTLTTDSDAVAKGLMRLIEAYPGSVTLDACAAGLPKGAQAELADALYKMVLSGMVQVLSEAVPGTLAISAQPTALPLARDDAAAGSGFTTNLRHETVGLDPAAQVLLPAMDGSRDHAALCQVLVEAARAGKITFNRDGAPVTKADEMERAAGEFLPQLLGGIAGSGLIAS